MIDLACWRGRPEGIFVNPFERGEIGADLFRAVCEMGLERSINAVSKPLIETGSRFNLQPDHQA